MYWNRDYILLAAIVISYIYFLKKDWHGRQMLKASEEKYKRLVEATPEAILVSDLSGVIRIADRQAVSMLGFSSSSEVEGKSGFTFIAAEDQDKVKEKLAEVIRSGKVSNVEYKSVRKNGSIFPTIGNVAVIRDAQGKPEGIMIVARDVTKETEIDQAKSEFYALAAHQLRTPLTTLRWDIERINDESRPLPAQDFRKVASRMYTQTLKIIDTVNTMLDTSLMEQGIVHTRPQRVKLEELFLKLIELYSPAAEKRKVTLELKKNKLGEAYIDPFRLEDAIGNLIHNAIKYTEPKGKVKVTAQRKGDILHIEVIDDGVGIPENEQPLVFTKFFRTAIAKKMDPGGSGLGLFSIKSYIESWGGAISLKSPVTRGRGTIFHIDIPIKEVL